jgi:hypothetical protein
MSEKRPVKLIAKQYKIRNDFGVLYTPNTPIDCMDLNAPECAFERAQVDAKVLIIVQEGNPEALEAAAIAEAEEKAAAEKARLDAEAEAAAKAEADKLAAEEVAEKPAKKA